MQTTAIIILYNPNVPIFNRLIDSILLQVNHIIIVDNSTDIKIKKNIQVWCENQASLLLHYIDLQENLGIAIAQNIGIKLALQLQSEFVLLLDQDSVLPIGMVKQLVASYQILEQQGKKVATIGPLFIDEKTGEKSKGIIYHLFGRKKIIPINGEIIKTDAIIASGSIVNIKNFDTIGFLREELFIDAVDTEWCLRAQNLGYDTFIDANVTILHSIGDEYVDILNKKINLHSDFRNYFIIRNNIYLIFYSKLKMGWKINQLIKSFIYVVFYSLYSKQKLYSLGLLTRAVWDGLTKKMGKGYFQDKGL